jgi:4-hydroxyphenylpyruvate dioxygenase-like putative hemolysin
MITRIDHIDIMVHDLKSHVAFFKRLGFQVIRETTHDGESVELQLPGDNQVIIELRRARRDHNPCINHIALTTSDITRTQQELIASGLEMDQDGFGDIRLNKATGRLTSNLRTPDGYRIQLVDEKRETPVVWNEPAR